MVAALLAFATPALAEPRELPASVVWVNGDRAYVASPDSSALRRGLRIELRDRRRTLATGQITDVVDRVLATVWLHEGSLARVKRLARVRVFGESGVVRPAPTLRVGFPAGTRENLAIDCPSPAFDETPQRFRAETLAPDAWRLVRIMPPDASAPWPDTLLVRLFAEAADEEIALERGDVDVAVFWPGERSTRMRDDPRWRDAPRGIVARGIVAAIAPDGAAAAADVVRHDPMLTALNAQMFAGDLLSWSELAPGPASSGDGGFSQQGAPSARYAVDAALPGRAVLERFLNRAAPGRANGRTIRLVTLDVPLADRDSLAGDWRDRGIAPLYALRCPVLSAAEHRAVVEALGADAIVNLAGCGARPRRP